MAMEILTQQRLMELVHYDPKTGKFTKNKKAVGCYSDGYLLLFLDGKRIAGHRAAWIYMHGSIDEYLVIDHINGIRDDNRIDNLRMVTHAQNMRNTGIKHTPSRLQTLLRENNWYFRRFDRIF